MIKGSTYSKSVYNKLKSKFDKNLKAFSILNKNSKNIFYNKLNFKQKLNTDKNIKYRKEKYVERNISRQKQK